MKWLLVYVALTGERVDVAKMGAYNTMNECFDARGSIRKTNARIK